MIPLSVILAVLTPIGLAPAAASETTFKGDVWVGGRLGVGVSSPSARVEIRVSSPTENALQISGFLSWPMFAIGPNGDAMVSTNGVANFDVSSFNTDWGSGLELRGGGTTFSSAVWQTLFGWANQGIHRHGIKSAHSGSASDSGLQFYLWTPAAGSSTSLPVVPPLALMTRSTGTSVHIRPVAQLPDVELVVSDGTNFGQGAVIRGSEGTHSSEFLKDSIRRLGIPEEDAALDETIRIKHASYRYKGSSRMRIGLIFEDAPESLRAPGRSLVVDERLVNAELALKALIRQLESAEARAGMLEAPR